MRHIYTLEDGFDWVLCTLQLNLSRTLRNFVSNNTQCPLTFQWNGIYSLECSLMLNILQFCQIVLKFFVDKIFMVKFLAMPCICYELEISWEKICAAMLRHKFRL